MMATIFQANPLQGFKSFFLIGHAVEVLREHDVFDGGQVGDEVKLLEHEADLFCAHAIQFNRGNAGHVLAVEPYLASGGPVEAPDQIHQRGFPGA